MIESMFLVLTLLADTSSTAVVFAEAQRLIDAGKAADAVHLLEQRTQEESRDADTWFAMADGYHVLMDEAGMLGKRGLAKKMKRALEQALKRDPEHVDARRELADFYHYAPWIAGGDEKKAALELDRLARYAPAEAHEARGRHARDEGDLETARDEYRAALEAGPREPARLLTLAVLEQQLDRYAESIALLDEALAAEPELEKAYYYRARASAMAGLDVERGLACASRYVEDCRECDDSDRGFGWWRRATLLKRTGDVDGAIEAYREALRLNPDLDGAEKALRELTR